MESGAQTRKCRCKQNQAHRSVRFLSHTLNKQKKEVENAHENENGGTDVEREGERREGEMGRGKLREREEREERKRGREQGREQESVRKREREQGREQESVRDGESTERTREREPQFWHTRTTAWWRDARTNNSAPCDRQAALLATTLGPLHR